MAWWSHGWSSVSLGRREARRFPEARFADLSSRPDDGAATARRIYGEDWKRPVQGPAATSLKGPAATSVKGPAATCLKWPARALTPRENRESESEATVLSHAGRRRRRSAKSTGRGRPGYSAPRIADCGLRIADCGLRIADCGLRIAAKTAATIQHPTPHNLTAPRWAVKRFSGVLGFFGQGCHRTPRYSIHAHARRRRLARIAVAAQAWRPRPLAP
jgi:hypothetical protein